MLRTAQLIFILLSATACSSEVHIASVGEDVPPPERIEVATTSAPLLCGADAQRPDAPLLYTERGADMVVLTAAGETRVLHTFFADQSVEPKQLGVLTVAHSNGWVVARMWRRIPQTPPALDGYEVEYLLLSAEQQVVWTLRESGFFPKNFYVAEDGTVIVDRGYTDNNASLPRPDGMLIRGDGQPVDLNGLWPVGEPVQGAVPVCGETSCGWLDLKSGLPNVMHDRPDWSYFWGDRWLYRDPSRPTAIVSEGHSDQFTIEIADAPSSIEIIGLRERWLLLADSVDGQGVPLETGTTLWRVDLQTGTVATHTLAMPEGLFWIDTSYCHSQRVGLTVDGDLMLLLRDAESARFHHVEFATGASSTLGQPLSQILTATSMSVTENTTLIGAASGLDTFCILPQWEPSVEPDVLLGDSIQLLIGGKLHSLPNNPELFSYHHGFKLWFERSGRCVAYPRDEAFEIFDVETEERTTLDWYWGGWIEPLR